MYGICPLASGSKGNSLYIGTKEAKILVDAGLSARAIRERLATLSVDIAEIDAILVTHEHGDHIRGLQQLGCRLGIPLFANGDTAKAICNAFQERPKFKIFTTGETFEFGGMEIHPFNVQHDALDPVAFTIRWEGGKLGVCTDLGFATTLVSAHLRECDHLYLEANHEPAMVFACGRPEVYKQRVLSRQGHLSNEQCAALLKEIAHPGLKHVYLAHLSSECNAPERALQVATEALEGRVEVSIAFQEKPSKPILLGVSAP